MNCLVKITASVFWLALATRAMAGNSATPNFQREIAPLLKNRCVRCHGPATTEAKLNLAVPSGVVRGGETGRAIVAGKPEKSLLWQRVAADEMPEDDPLPADEKDLLRRWIEAGVPGLPTSVTEHPDGDEHWAFQILRPVSPPVIRDASRVRTAVDAFIEDRLEAAGRKIGPEADRNTLIRRVAFDLTGLPPTVTEIATFLSDHGDGAYERMVERYLASPRYGERWGKYWLDTAGYADSNGYFNADTDRPLAYRYRDYVIRSVNADKPWDRFVREQLAGDEMAGYKPGGNVTPDMIELLEATHYLRNSPDGTDSSDGNPDELRTDKYAVLEGTMQIIGASLLGITVQCGKCHDHKFEPFTQRDYYALQAILYPAFNVEKWVKPKQREIVAATAADIAAWESKAKRSDQQISQRRREFSQWLSQYRERGKVLFQDAFDESGPRLTDNWSNTAPGDEESAGKPAVQIDSTAAPGAHRLDGHLRIMESADAGDRAISTKQVFDWSPNEQGDWIQVTFDLLPGADKAPYVGFLFALQDFNDSRRTHGGNVLIDAAAAGKAAVHVDYPGGDDSVRGQIGQSGCVPGRNYGIRITSRGKNEFELALVVDGEVEDGTVVLTADDLPDGGFGFEYCCGRSFVVDNVRIEAGNAALRASAEYKHLTELRQKKRMELEADVKKLETQKGRPLPRLAPVYDLSPDPPEVFVLNRGDYKSPKEKAEIAGPHALCDSQHPASLMLRVPPSKNSTGRRLAFARWLTEPDSRASSLLARVTVNRLWLHHFGKGIVATPDNLGYSGAAPPHPELLEYLASEFIRSGWSAKAIHRLILNSATYRQSSRPIGNVEQIDPDNELLGRFPLRRLDAEAIRDGMLAISGELGLQTGGPYVPTSRNDEGAVVMSESTPGTHRRSIYLQQRRTQVPNMLQVFDAPSIVFSCTFRTPTTVPLQSLNLLNSEFVRLRSKALAERVAAAAGSEIEERIRYAFLLVTGRPPSKTEFAAAQRFIAQQIQQHNDKPKDDEFFWVDYCQTLLASDAFLYVE